MNAWRPSRITSVDMQEASTYSRDVVLTCNYSDCNQTNIDKIINDHYIGKLGEFAVWRFILSKGVSCNPPDCKIYDRHEKSWDSDLKIGGRIPLAVKTMKEETANKFGWSWTFQCDRNGRRDKEYMDSVVSFVKSFNDGTFLVSVPVDPKTLKFSNPRASYLIGKKLVVYQNENEYLKE